MKWGAFLSSATDRLASVSCFIVSKPCQWNDPHSCLARCCLPRTPSLIHVSVSEQCPWKNPPILPSALQITTDSISRPCPAWSSCGEHLVGLGWREELRGGASSASATSGCCMRLQQRRFAGRQSLSSDPWHCRARFLYPAAVLLLRPCFLFTAGLALLSPWYNRTGWRGVKHQLTYLLTYLLILLNFRSAVGHEQVDWA